MSATRKPWLPQSLEKKYQLIIRTTVPYVDSNRVTFGMGADTPLGKWYDDVFTAVGFTLFSNAYAHWSDPTRRTPVAIAQMRSAEKEADPLFRELYRMLKANPKVTNADLTAMGLPERTVPQHKPSPVADTAPQFGIVPLTGHRIQVDYYPEGATHKKGKPGGQHGAEIRWAFSETPVDDANRLANSAFDTASPAILAFEGHERGRTVYLALRWENTRGEKGPWSDIAVTTVP
ncbi:MAG: hypothetical protein LBS04_07475 [Tannerellaceae bacterium]|jgi:hypothetical protein|nr:hypothetical protein [Tannerellaceae bacterium]